MGSSEPTEPERQEDNVRIYVPIDLNREAILRRLREIINRYEEANEDNEMDFESEVWRIVSQIEIYDQIWSVRNTSNVGEHSKKAVDLIAEFIAVLEEIPDGCAETFPFEMIDELRAEYLGKEF